MALTPAQRKWATGGTIAAGALLIGYELFRSRPAHAGFLPVVRPHEGHEHRKKHRRHEDRDEQPRENERGEYGQKKKHHHRGHRHD